VNSFCRSFHDLDFGGGEGVKDIAQGVNLGIAAVAAVGVKIQVVLRRGRLFSRGGHYRFSAGHTSFGCRFQGVSIGDSLPIAFQVFFCDFFGRDEFVMFFGTDPDSAIGLLELK
jgi:hypothetical protein